MRSESISVTLIIWVAVAFFEAACWGLVVVVDKRVLDFVTPLAVNLGVRAVSLVLMLVVVLPLTLLHLWSLTFAMTWDAAGVIAISAFVTWMLAFNCYYFALRAGRASVVAPITSTDPLFAALFSAILIGSALGGLTIAGLAVATAGVVLFARWLEPASEAHAEIAAPLPGADYNDPVRAVVLSMLTAAGWGMGPVLIEVAERGMGGPSATMMLESQFLGMLMLAVVVKLRRVPLLTRKLSPPELRLALLLLLTAGALETVFSILYYLVIDHIGAVLVVLIVGTSPIFSIVGGIILLKEKFGAKLALAASITLGGVFLATLQRVLT